MLDNIKTMMFREGAPLHDWNKRRQITAARTKGGVAGRVVIRNPKTGEVVLDKWNTIVLRGRVFAIEKLFGDVVPNGTLQGATVYKQNLSRVLVAFGIGTGGTPIGNPFSPTPPSFSDMDLAAPAPFRKYVSNDLANYPALTPAEMLLYSDSRTTVAAGVTTTTYYKKQFESVPVWSIDTVGNEVYKKLILRIDELDARSMNINELALYMGHYDPVMNTMADLEIFSRITFPTENLNDPSKQLLIEYYIYA
jgi:hypothetical protein